MSYHLGKIDAYDGDMFLYWNDVHLFKEFTLYSYNIFSTLTLRVIHKNLTDKWNISAFH